MTRRGWGAGVLLVTALALVGSACGDHSSNSASTGAKSAAVGGAAAPAAPAGAAASPLDVGDPAQRKQVRTGDLTLATRSSADVTGVADQAVAIAVGAGGQADGDRRTGGADATAVLVLRVPPEALDATVDQLAGLAEVTSRSVQTDDVTAQYTDLEGRIAALQTSTARLRGFLASATDANQIASIESELTKRESDLESMQGQLRVLSAKTDLATLTVTVRTHQSVANASAPAPAKALSTGWDTFSLVMAWALAIVLATAPFLALLVVALVIRRWWKGRRPSRPESGGSAFPPPPPTRPGSPAPPPAPAETDPEPVGVG